MSDLSYWRLKKRLTAHEVASLACGIDPTHTKRMYQEEIPEGWQAIYDAVIEGFMTADSEFAELFCDETFNKYTIDRPAFDELDIPSYHHYQIDQQVIRNWFVLNEIKPAYFFPDQENEQHQEAKYKTTLMGVMQKAIARYYGENFDVNDSDSYPKQVTIIDWLRTEFSLSKRQAEAIEIIITHRNDNYPKG